MLTKIIDGDATQKLRTYIDKGDSFVIVTHEMPDGDAIGSSLGLYHYLMTLGKQSVKVIVPNPFPVFLRWMPAAKEILVFEQHKEFATQLIQEADVIFCLDFNAFRRTGIIADTLRQAEARKILIDHHLDPEDGFKLTFSHPTMSSTCELVFRLICRLGAADAINKEMAECIYTGMMTDTGSFSYNSNHAEIYTIIGELIKIGIDKDAIYRKVNQVYSESRLRLMGYVLYEKMKVFPEKQAAYFTLSQKELNRFHYRPGDTEGFVNLPLSINGISFSAFLREETNLIKISLRSVGDFPCNQFAATYFNGGGHKNASGGEFRGSLEEAVATLERGLLQMNPNKIEK